MLATLLAVAALRAPSRRSLPVALARASTLGPRELAALHEEQTPLWERLLRPALSPLARRMRTRWSGIDEETLRRAGIDPARVSVEEVVALKLLGGVAGAVVVLAVAVTVPAAIVLLPAAAFGGFVAPSVVITGRRMERRRRILRELPDLG